MSNLNTNKSTVSVFNLIGIGMLVVAISLMISTQYSINKTERSIAETQALLDQYSAAQLGELQQSIYDNEGHPMTLPPFTVEAPTSENPFGGYDGTTILIPIVQDGNVWTVLDSYNAESVIPLSYEANEELIHNLVNELGRQLDRDPSLVHPGEVLEIDLTAWNVATTPPVESYNNVPPTYLNEGTSSAQCNPFWVAACDSNGE